MSSNLNLPKGKRVKKPLRDPDHVSKRGVPYWFAPEWVRDVNGTVSRIIPLKTKNGEVELNMLAKSGSVSYIRGSIQREFEEWHLDRQIDHILLGVDEDEIIATDWEYE